MVSISAKTWSVGAHGSRRSRRITSRSNGFTNKIYVVKRPNATIQLFVDSEGVWGFKRHDGMSEALRSVTLPRKYAASLLLAVIKSGRK